MLRTPHRLKLQPLAFGFTLTCAFFCMLMQSTSVFALPVQPHFNHFLYTHPEDEIDDNGNDGGTVQANLLVQQRYADSAYPASAIAYDQTTGAYDAFQGVMSNAAKWNNESWHLIGPTVGNVDSLVAYTGRATTTSGRVTALLVSKNCTNEFC